MEATLISTESTQLLERFGPSSEPLFATGALENGADTSWIVTAGFVDLFMTELPHNGQASPRHYVGRIETGDIYLPIAHRLPAGWTVAPLPSSDAQGTRFHFNVLASLATDPEYTSAIEAALGRWVGLLTSALPGSSLQPKAPILLSAAEGTQKSRENYLVAPREQIVWITVEGEGSTLLGRRGLVLPPQKLFPLASPGWIETTHATVTRSTSELAAHGELQAAMEEFYPVAFAGVIEGLLEREMRERHRLVEKQRGDSNRVDFSMRQLTMASRRNKGRASAFADLGNPLMSACEAIGEVQGITFVPPPEVVRGLPLRDPVATVARASGVRFRRVVLKNDDWNASETPFLAFRESDRAPLACLPVKGKKYVVFDPAAGTTTPLTPELLRTCEPFVFLFYRPFPHRAIKAKDLILFGLKGSWKDVFLIVVVGLLGSALSLATPIVTGTIFDTIIPGAQRSRLMMTAFVLFAASISSALFGLCRSFAILRLEGKMDARVQAAIWDRLLGLPVPFFRKYSAGDLASRGLAVSSMRQILTGSAMSSLMSGIFSITSFCLLFYYSSHLAYLATGLTLLALIVTTVCSLFQIKRQRDQLELHGKISGMVLQFIFGIAKLRVSGTENRAFVSWANMFAKQKTIATRSRKIANIMAVFNSVFPLVSTGAIFFLVSYEMAKPGAKPLTTGEFLAFNSAYGQFSGALMSLAMVFLSLLGIVPLYERAKPVLQTLPEVDASKPHAGDLTGRVELNHVNFRYREDGPLILKDVNVDIQPGEFVAFVGPSGAGKSTLFRLFLGFDVPESGAIYFDGQDLANIDIQSVRQQMGVVMQNASLFAGDVYSNITCSAPYTIDEAWEAARLAGLEKDLSTMPMGMHTVVGDGGAGLSGGQRQRLMIARAIVGKPRILLFDEATSALDNKTQALVSKSLEDLNSTRIVIAHRLSTIVNADKIYVVEAGQIVQSGTYNQLINQPGLFQDLAKRQMA